MPATIIHPVNGGRYPIVDPAPVPPVHSAYFASSFGLTRLGGPVSVKWGFDAHTIATGP